MYMYNMNIMNRRADADGKKTQETGYENLLPHIEIELSHFRIVTPMRVCDDFSVVYVNGGAGY